MNNKKFKGVPIPPVRLFSYRRGRMKKFIKEYWTMALWGTILGYILPLWQGLFVIIVSSVLFRIFYSQFINREK